MPQQPQYIFMYGLLMQGQFGHEKYNLKANLKFVSKATCKGALYNLGRYPGAVLDEDGIIRGELYELTNQDTLDLLDAYEEYTPSAPENCLYIRKQIKLLEPEVTAWVYEYVKDIPENSKIVSGSWI